MVTLSLSSLSTRAPSGRAPPPTSRLPSICSSYPLPLRPHKEFTMGGVRLAVETERSSVFLRVEKSCNRSKLWPQQSLLPQINSAAEHHTTTEASGVARERRCRSFTAPSRSQHYTTALQPVAGPEGHIVKRIPVSGEENRVRF